MYLSIVSKYRVGRAIGALAFVWALSFLYFRSQRSTTDGILSRIMEYNPTGTKELVSTSSPDDTFSSADDTLKGLCRQTQWTDGLWLTCHSHCGPNKTSICGGVNNARNRVQTCLRLAISVGAGVIIPHVTTRVESQIELTDNTIVCPDVWWDMDYLIESMANLCPRLQIRTCEEDPGIAKVVQLPNRHYRDRPHYCETFRRFVNDSLTEAQISLAEVNSFNPVLIQYGDSHLAWSYRDTGELGTIRKALFKTIIFNQALVDLGGEIFNSEQLQSGNFIGVHLRAESDWPGHWGTNVSQMELHVQEIVRTNSKLAEPVKIIYVSCGDRDAIQQFRDMLTPMDYTVHDKWTVLEDRPEMLERVSSLTFDEKGIVEYAVLVRARFWQGLLISTMSSVIAYARTMDEPEDFFHTYIYPRSARWGIDRNYADNLSIKGNEDTKLYVVDGQDNMDAFP